MDFRMRRYSPPYKIDFLETLLQKFNTTLQQIILFLKQKNETFALYSSTEFEHIVV